MKIFLCLQATLIAIICVTTGCTDDKNPDGNFQSGKFYTLSEAYDNGWLSDGDVQNIVYYYAPDDYPDYTPLPKNPETLSAETELNIKQSYLNSIKSRYPQATIENIIIPIYYGTYGNCVAVQIYDNLAICHDPLCVEEMKIGNLVLKFFCPSSISIWISDEQ